MSSVLLLEWFDQWWRWCRERGMWGWWINPQFLDQHWSEFKKISTALEDVIWSVISKSCINWFWWGTVFGKMAKVLQTKWDKQSKQTDRESVLALPSQRLRVWTRMMTINYAGGVAHHGECQGLRTVHSSVWGRWYDWYWPMHGYGNIGILFTHFKILCTHFEFKLMFIMILEPQRIPAAASN